MPEYYYKKSEKPYTMKSAAISLLFSTLALGASLPETGLGRRQGGVITSCTQPGVIALTFDDGPWQYEQTIIDQLNAAGAKATFFIAGNLYQCIYNGAASMQNAYNAGHQLASHTWSHTNMAGLQPSQIQNEMTQVENAFATILGVKPNYMRPPEGATGGSVVPTLSQMGYSIITWDVDTQDWNNVPPSQSEQIIQQAGTFGNGHIVLMHETIPTTANQLASWAINYATQNGLKMVTVAECLGDAGGEYTPATGDGSSFC